MSRAFSLLLKIFAFLYLIVLFLGMGLALVPALWIVQAGWDSGSIVFFGLSLGAGYLAFGLSFLVLIVVLKHATFFRAEPGDYPFVSLYVLRWAVIGAFVGLAKVVILRHLLGMPVLNLFYQLMGARIGRDVVINSCNIFDFDLLAIGDGTLLGGDCVVIGHVGEQGMLRLRPVTIGRGCTIGQSSVVFPGAVMEDGAVLGALSLLPKDRRLPAGTRWGGNPLVLIEHGIAERVDA
jgi:non-ribosomal peptide synthetase-like protein